jgi:hypothetical protein
MNAPHSCNPPQQDLPEPGGSWTCPECGRRWRLEDVADDASRGGPGQRLMWTFDGGPPPVPKDEPEHAEPPPNAGTAA